MSKKTQIKHSNATGRPPVQFSPEEWKKINQFLQAQCDGAAIARLMGVHPDTLYAMVIKKYGKEYNITTFSAYMQLKRREGIELVRAKQFEKALANGDNGMLIWLGKQYLGQREQIEQTITVPQVHVQALDEKSAGEISTAMIALEQAIDEGNDSIQEEPDSDK